MTDVPIVAENERSEWDEVGCVSPRPTRVRDLERLVRQLRDAILIGTPAERWEAAHDATAYMEGAPAAPQVRVTHARCEGCEQYLDVRRFPLANVRKDGSRHRFHFCRSCLATRHPTEEEQLAVKRRRSRDHMRRMRQDPVYVARGREAARAYAQRKRREDPTYVERHRAYMRDYNARYNTRVAA